MKRFIDLRNQGASGKRFAWYNTVIDQFESFGGDQSWDDWNDFLESLSRTSTEPDRYRALVPDWAFQPKPEFHHWPEMPGFQNGRLERMDRRLYLDQGVEHRGEVVLQHTLFARGLTREARRAPLIRQRAQTEPLDLGPEAFCFLEEGLGQRFAVSLLPRTSQYRCDFHP